MNKHRMRPGSHFSLSVMGQKKAYWKKVRQLFGSNLIGYWPLFEGSGTVARDLSGNGYNATYNGVTLASGVSPAGKPCPYFNGNNGQYISLNGVSAFLNIVSFDEGAYFCKFKPDTALLTDTTSRGLVIIKNDSTGANIKIDKGSPSYQLTASRHNGSAYDPWNAFGGFSTNGWHDVIISWSKAGSYVRLYVDGFLINTVALGTSKAEHPDIFIIGAMGATFAWQGYISDAGYVNRPVTADEALKFHVYTTPIVKTISFYGDSISTDLNGWDKHVIHTYQGGKIKPINHAVGGQSISANLATQIAAGASDNADISFIQMGVNDDNAGNMTTLQGKVESAITTLKASNPRTTIYWINVLKTWTDATFATELDKANIRAAIAAGCAAQGVTCIDTYTSPWLTTAQMNDNKHPNAAGYYIYGTNVLAVLP